MIYGHLKKHHLFTSPGRCPYCCHDADHLDTSYPFDLATSTLLPSATTATYFFLHSEKTIYLHVSTYVCVEHCRSGSENLLYLYVFRISPAWIQNWPLWLHFILRQHSSFTSFIPRIRFISHNIHIIYHIYTYLHTKNLVLVKQAQSPLSLPYGPYDHVIPPYNKYHHHANRFFTFSISSSSSSSTITLSSSSSSTPLSLNYCAHLSLTPVLTEFPFFLL